MSVLAAAGGAYVHLFTNVLRGGGIMLSLLGVGLALGLFMTPDNGKNRSTRLAMLLGFAFFSGILTSLRKLLKHLCIHKHFRPWNGSAS